MEQLHAQRKGRSGKVWFVLLATLVVAAVIPPRVYSAPARGPATPSAAASSDPAANPLPAIRHQVPSAEDQARGLTTVQAIFKAEYARTGQADRRKLAAQLLERGKQVESDTLSRYIFLEQAREVGAASGEAEVAREAAEQLTGHFAISMNSLALETLTRLAPRSAGLEAAAAEWGLDFIDELLSDQSFETAAKIVPLIVPVVSRARAPAMQERLKMAQATLTEYQKVKPLMERLVIDPADAAANLAVGKFHAYSLGQWDTAVSMLILGSDKALKDVAARELGQPTQARDRFNLAGVWWDLAKSYRGAEAAAIKEHAADLYEAVKDELSGLDKELAASRSAEAAPPEATPAGATQKEAALLAAAKRGTNLTHFDIKGAGITLTRLTNGVRIYIRGSQNTFNEIPGWLNGWQFNRKEAPAELPRITVTARQPTAILIYSGGPRKRITDAGWKPTGDAFKNNQGKSFPIYFKVLNAGEKVNLLTIANQDGMQILAPPGAKVSK